MNETSDDIESHIRHTRANLGANLNELEGKVKSAADWRLHYAKSPGVFLGTALAGGLLLALATNGHRSRRSSPLAPAPQAPPSPPPRENRPPNEPLNVIKVALIGLAANHVKSALSTLLPGFAAQLPENEKPRTARAPDDLRHGAGDRGETGIG